MHPMLMMALLLTGPTVRSSARPAPTVAQDTVVSEHLKRFPKQKAAAGSDDARRYTAGIPPRAARHLGGAAALPAASQSRPAAEVHRRPALSTTPSPKKGATVRSGR